jgi:hypothetical protein
MEILEVADVMVKIRTRNLLQEKHIFWKTSSLYDKRERVGNSTAKLFTSITEMPGSNPDHPDTFSVAFSVPLRKFRIHLHLTPGASFRIPANSLPNNRRYTVRHRQRRKQTRETNDVG